MDENNEIVLEGILSGGYGIIPKKIMQAQNIGVYEKLLLAYMLSFSGGGRDICYPSYMKMQQDLNVGRTTLSKSVKNLCDKGYIRVDKLYPDDKYKNNNKYTLLFLSWDVHNANMACSRDEHPQSSARTYNNNIINNNILNISSKEDIWNSDEFHNKPSSIKEKQTTSSDQKEYFPHPFLEYWNSKPNLRTHKVTSKDYQNAAGMFNMLQNGVFGNLYRIEHEYAQTNKIKPETMRKVFTEEEIKAVIDKFDLMCSSDYVSKIKDGYPKSCSAFLWNPKTNRSFFMALYSSDNDIKPIKEAPMRQDVIDYYKDSLRLRNLNESEEADLVRSVNFIERRKVEYEKKMNQYGGCPYRLSGGNFYKTHLEWVRIKLQDTGRFELWKIANKFSWGDFVKWVKSNYGSECDMEIEIKDVKIMEECYN